MLTAKKQQNKVSIQRLTDHSYVDAVMKHPDVYPWITDDFTPDPDDFYTETLIDNENFYFVGTFVDDAIAGVFMFHPMTKIMYEMHSAVLPDYRGLLSVTMAVGAAEWIFRNTDCLKLITYVPAGNIAALALARRGGMKAEGVITESFMKGGTMIDQTILGITKEELTCQQYQH